MLYTDNSSLSIQECYSRKKTQQSVGAELGVKREPMPPTPVKMEEDIGNRSSTISLLTSHLELAITVFVKFAKAIPGFCDLTLNDQAALVKCKSCRLLAIKLF